MDTRSILKGTIMLPNTIKSTDKIKVARVIADMLGVEKADKMSPEQAINVALRNVKNKRMTPELASVLRKMLSLANEVGIKVDNSLLPNTIKEGAIEADTGSVLNGGVDITMPITSSGETKGMRFKQYMKKKTAPQMDNYDEDQHTETGSSLDDDKKDDDQLRRRKADYITTEETSIEEDLASADYKVSKSGRKYRAHHITFKNSKSGAKLADDPDNEDEDNIVIRESSDEDEFDDRIEDDLEDIDDGDLDDMADEVDDEEDIIDVYDEDELSIVDAETGEIDDEEELDEQALCEVMSRVERMRAKFRMLKTKGKRMRKLQIALKKRSDTKTLVRRARKLAVQLLKKRILKKNPSNLTIAEKERVEKIIEKRKKFIDRLAMRLLPKVRKIENDRLTHQKVTK